MTRIKIAHITTARSDYAPCYWLLSDLFADTAFDVQLVVAGSHLSKRHGMTVDEINRDGWKIHAKIPFLHEENDAGYIDASGTALKAFGEFFAREKPDIAMVYGDRFELLPICSAAVITCTPIAHVCGGDLTQGAIDEQVRHAVTKMAHVHFTSTEHSARRILQMGEETWRVHQTGDPAIDNFVRTAQATPEELASVLGFNPDRSTLLVSFHPVTLEAQDIPRQAAELAAVLRAHNGWVVITAPAPDAGSNIIRAEMEKLARNRPKTIFTENLGGHRYRGLMRLVGAMVGNSSSGLNEAPCVPLPVVNISNRQLGRDRASNVIDVPADRDSIEKGLKHALSPQFRESLRGMESPYGDGNAAQKIVKVLHSLPPRPLLLKKLFAEMKDTM